MKTAFASILLLICVVGFAYSDPIHASCKLTWSWSKIDCAKVSAAISDQMLKWKTIDKCNNTEMCGYAISSNTSTEIKGTHETPVKHYKDDLTMTFAAKDGDCEVQGYSTSETWYAHLDYGTNYCNLHNLVTGAGLDKEYDFKEMTSDSDCTQYSSSNCGKY